MLGCKIATESKKWLLSQDKYCWGKKNRVFYVANILLIYLSFIRNWNWFYLLSVVLQFKNRNWYSQSRLWHLSSFNRTLLALNLLNHSCDSNLSEGATPTFKAPTKNKLSVIFPQDEYRSLPFDLVGNMSGLCLKFWCELSNRKSMLSNQRNFLMMVALISVLSFQFWHIISIYWFALQEGGEVEVHAVLRHPDLKQRSVLLWNLVWNLQWRF